ncbi:MAG: lipid-binding SYLF domain-containing protein, partial [Planctomycetota bacterium]
MQLASHPRQALARCLLVLTLVGFVSPVLVSCRTPGGSTPAQKRAAIQEMRRQTLGALFRARPSAEAQVRRAPGYAVFANVSTKILVLGLGNGYGVVADNRGGGHTYMRMFQAGAGWGMGIKQFRAVIVFKSSAAMRRFVKDGWTLKGDAEATLKAGRFGGGIGHVIPLANMTVYILTEA